MSMRIHQMVTHLRPEDAYSIVEFLDQLRDMLLQAYGEDIRTMLQEAALEAGSQEDDGEEF